MAAEVSPAQPGSDAVPPAPGPPEPKAPGGGELGESEGGCKLPTQHIEGLQVPRQPSDPDFDASAWKIDGSGKGGHYHNIPSLGLVTFAQINYIISLVVVIPTAAGYAASLGATSAAFFGVVVGVSSIVNPLVSRVWNTVIRATSLNTVLLINASICLICSLMYVAAKDVGGAGLLLASRVFLGVGSVQTANLKYLGCAVSTKRVKFAHFLTTAAIAYGFAVGALIAFPLSLLAVRYDWDQNTLPGWFSALTWLGYIVLHCLMFVEPNRHAGLVDPESRIRLDKDMKPKCRREPLASLAPCMAAIFGIAIIKGAFEVMTIEITQELWQWDVMTSAMYLGVTMFLVALTTLLSWRLERRLGEGRTFFLGLLGASLLLPLYYVPISSWHHERMVSVLGMGIYFVVSILALSSLNLGRTIAFSLITELPSPHWRNYFLSFGSEMFTMGRGVGPILAGCIADRQIMMSVLIGVCTVSAWWVGHAWATGALEHEEHELGPARAELGEAPVEQEAEPTMMDEIRKDIDEWWSAFEVKRDIDEWWSSLGFSGGATPSRREVRTPAAKERSGPGAGTPSAPLGAVASAASAWRKVVGGGDRPSARGAGEPAAPRSPQGAAAQPAAPAAPAAPCEATADERGAPGVDAGAATSATWI